ncbi:unnamed protein product, partial [Linum tenue]
DNEITDTGFTWYPRNDPGLIHGRALNALLATDIIDCDCYLTLA